MKMQEAIGKMINELEDYLCNSTSAFVAVEYEDYLKLDKKVYENVIEFYDRVLGHDLCREPSYSYFKKSDR